VTEGQLLLFFCDWVFLLEDGIAFWAVFFVFFFSFCWTVSIWLKIPVPGFPSLQRVRPTVLYGPWLVAGFFSRPAPFPPFFCVRVVIGWRSRGTSTVAISLSFFSPSSGSPLSNWAFFFFFASGVIAPADIDSFPFWSRFLVSPRAVLPTVGQSF